jgi:hypothetical protein
MQHLLYVFGITDCDIGAVLPMEQGTYCINIGRVFALVTQVSATEFGEANIQQNLENPAWLAEKVHKHEQVLQFAMYITTVIPLKFGTVFQHTDSLINTLSPLQSQFTNQLTALRGKKEWGLKIYTRRDLLAQVAEKQPAIAQIQAEIDIANAGKAFLLKKKKQQLLHDAMLEEGIAVGKWVLYRVKNTAWHFQQGKLLSKHAHGKEAELLLNLSVLVPVAEEAAFFEWAEALDGQLREKGAFSEQNGPWPPYHFTDLT